MIIKFNYRLVLFCLLPIFLLSCKKTIIVADPNSLSNTGIQASQNFVEYLKGTDINGNNITGVETRYSLVSQGWKVYFEVSYNISPPIDSAIRADILSQRDEQAIYFFNDKLKRNRKIFFDFIIDYNYQFDFLHPYIIIPKNYYPSDTTFFH